MKFLCIPSLFLFFSAFNLYSQSFDGQIESGEIVSAYTYSDRMFVMGYRGEFKSFDERIQKIVLPDELEYQFDLKDSKVKMLGLRDEIPSSRIEEILSALRVDTSVRYLSPGLEMSSGDRQGVFDEIIVQIKSNSSKAALTDFIANHDLKIIEEDPDIEGVYILRSDSMFSADLINFSNHLNRQRFVEFAEPNFIVIGHGNTNDTYYSMQWYLKNTGQYAGTVGADIDIENAWTVTTGSGSIKIAILDCWGSTSQFNHPDINFAATHDATNSGFGATGFAGDAHGIACAGLVGATRNNNTGIAGVAPGCGVIAVKICTIVASNGNWAGTNTQIKDGIVWAYGTGGADVISNSNTFGSPSSIVNTAISQAVNNGRGGKGTPFLSSAGNNNSTNLGYPASNANTMAVAATSNCDERKSVSSCDQVPTWGSNYGSGVDISAPGTLIVTTDITGGSGYSSGDYNSIFNGTSAACPIAAGVMGLILSEDPSLSESQVRFAIESTCDKVGGYPYNNGVSGQPNGTWSNDLGYGRINAYDAVSSVQSGPSNDDCSNAITLTVNQTCITTQGSNVGASETIGPGDVSCDSPANVDVWYKLTVPANGDFHVFTNSLTNPNLDFGLGIYTGSCGSLSEIACLQNGNGTMPAGLVSLPSQYWNTTVYLRLQEYGSVINTGAFEICIYSPGGNQAPVADFSVSNQNPQLNSTVQFNDLSTNNPTAWVWTISPGTYNFVNGTHQNSQDPQVEFTAAGSYDVSLQAQNPYGFDNEVKTSYVVVSSSGNAPNADFTVSNSFPQVNQSVSFTDQSTNSPTSWQWTFTPNSVQYLSGTSSNSQDPVVQFTASGSYDVRLEATNTFGNDVEVKNNYVTVSGGAPPVAEFIANRTLVQVNELVQLNDLSVGNPTSWNWTIIPGNFTFQGGSSASSQNISIKFTTPGDYAVQLQVQNGQGSDIEMKSAYIRVFNQAPSLQFVSQYGGGSTGWKIGQAQSGGYFLSGRTLNFGNDGDFFLAKLDDHGDMLWDKVYGTSSDDEGWGAIQLNDKGFFLWGVTDHFNSNSDGIMIKTDSLGNVEWARNTDNASTDYFTSANQGPSGDIFVSSRKSIYKFSVSGNLLWSKYFSNISNLHNMFVLANGDMFVTGLGGNLDFQLARINSSGNVVFAKEIGITGVTGYSYLETANTTSDGGVIMLARRDFGQDQDGIVIKANSSGTIQWARRIGNTAYQNFFDVVETSDGGYMVCGRTHQYNPNKGFLVKLNGNGQTEWNKLYEQSQFSSIVETIDNGFAMTSNFNGQMTLVKTDGDGNLGCNESSFTIANVSASTQQNNFSFSNSSAPSVYSLSLSTTFGFSNSLFCDNFGPTANFVASDLQPDVGDQVYLIDQSQNSPTTWNWTISPTSYQYTNSTASGSQSPYVSFSAPGLYTITLQVSNSYGTDQVTKTNYVNVVQTVGFEESDEFDQIKLFPNPNDGIFTIEVRESGIYALKVFDLAGKMFYSAESEISQREVFDFDWLASGVYVFQLSRGQARYMTKFVKN